MSIARLILPALIVAGLATSGCYYKRPDIEGKFASTEVGMSKEEVIQVIGHQPTFVDGNEMFFNYDDPTRAVRLRYVLNDQNVVVEKYLELKQELVKKAEEMAAQGQPIKPLPGEENRTYPGGPLPRFEKKPGVGGY
jgi:hypothetical protein